MSIKACQCLCGLTPSISEDDHSHETSWGEVRCNNPTCPVVSIRDTSKEKAIIRWNKFFGAPTGDDVIDRKFQFVARNPVNGKVYTPENAMIFVAKDKALPVTLTSYLNECRAVGAAEEHLESVKLLRDRVVGFQVKKDCRVPDTDLPGEIKRCIDGDLS